MKEKNVVHLFSDDITKLRGIKLKKQDNNVVQTRDGTMGEPHKG